MNIDEKSIDFSLEIVEKQRYEHSSAFDFEYTGQCIKAGSIIKPDGLVSAINLGINPKNGKAFQTKIEGFFQDGLPNGYCIVYFPEGQIYKGMMKDGEMNGNGIYYETIDSKPIKLECKNGNCIEI
jgi:antitoxin component YwqK of YwqJK toxin-antitoxin module